MSRPTNARLKHLWVALAFSVALYAPGWAEPPFPVEVYYAPTDNLERQDLELIRAARKSIDFAAFTFSDFAVIDALADAAKRGVHVRILLDPSQLRQRQELALSRIEELTKISGVTARIKSGSELMHLKSYAIDGAVLRSGSANFTPSGLKRQNNDLVVIRSTKAAERFSAEFSKVFDRAVPATFP